MSDTELIWRIVAGALCGVLIGFERARENKNVGVRTLTMVALGGAVLTASVAYSANGDPNAASRAFQGLVTSIGFLGAGLILQNRKQVRGLTTAAAVWLAAILGGVAGLGLPWVALACAAFAFTLLALGDNIDKWIIARFSDPAEAGPGKVDAGFPSGPAQNQDRDPPSTP
jgi:putative Mg2+ transporter-C (MgtC) family protein